VLVKDSGDFGNGGVVGGWERGWPFSTPSIVGPPKAEEYTYRILNHPTSLFYNVKGP